MRIRTSRADRQRRYRMAVAYLSRRAFPGAALVGQPHHIEQYNDWVDAFPKFMVIAHPGRIKQRGMASAVSDEGRQWPRGHQKKVARDQGLPEAARRALP